MYYGIDSDTAVFPTGASTHDFYVGRLGGGTTPDTQYYNVKGASLASHVYMYWDIFGPKVDPNYKTPYSIANALAWGKRQADVALVAYRSRSIITRTIFGDVEGSKDNNRGYFLISDPIPTDGALNYAVFEGFIDTIRAAGYKAGVYTSSGCWGDIMTSSTINTPAYADTVWGANWPGIQFNSPPSSMNECNTINGVAPTIWQYYGEPGDHDPNVTGDADVATFLPV